MSSFAAAAANLRIIDPSQISLENKDEFATSVIEQAGELVPQVRAAKYVKWGIMSIVFILIIILISVGASKNQKDNTQGRGEIISGVFLGVLLGTWIYYAGFGIGKEALFNIKNSPSPGISLLKKIF